MGLTTDNGLPYQGVLDFMGNQMNRSTGTIRARAVILTPTNAFSGLFARISLPIGEPRETVLIDDLAVSADQGKNYVLIVGKENQVEYRPVELGQMVDGFRVVTQSTAGRKNHPQGAGASWHDRCATSGADAAECDRQTDRDID